MSDKLTRLFAVWAILIAVVLLRSTDLYPTEWTGAFAWRDALLWCALLLAVVGGVLTGDWLFGRDRERQQLARFGESERWRIDDNGLRVSQAYCGDCGALFESRRKTLGYSTKTGQVMYSFDRACPKANYGTTGYPQCNQRTVIQPTAGLHSHLDQETHTDCAVCIDGMIRDGVLSVEAADPLYQKANAVVPMRVDGDFGTLMKLGLSPGLLTPPTSMPRRGVLGKKP